MNPFRAIRLWFMHRKLARNYLTPAAEIICAQIESEVAAKCSQ